MKKEEFLAILNDILEQSRIGILATVNSKGGPAMRWLTPGVLNDFPGTLYALTAKSFEKTKQLENNPAAQWQFQTRTLDKVMNLDVEVTLIDNSSLKTRVIESIGPRLNVFWKLNDDPSELLVIESRIISGQVFYPMKAEKIKVDLIKR